MSEKHNKNSEKCEDCEENSTGNNREKRQGCASEHNDDCDVVIIGAGPAGTVAACLLRQRGYRVLVLERQRFPRFVIGESLLPQSLQTLEKAGCLAAVSAYGFQRKTGATFKSGERSVDVIFEDKFSDGPGHAFHVERADFDQILAHCAMEQGADVRFAHEVVAVDLKRDDCRLDWRNRAGQSGQVRCRFVLDASGYGRVLPRVLGIDRPSSLPMRGALFTHFTDHIAADSGHQRNTTLVAIHPHNPALWFWLISFANGRSSLGVVGDLADLQPHQARGLAGLKALVAEEPNLSRLLRHADFDMPAQTLSGYSSSVSQFYGDGFALLGNAAEFLDPVFSSGVTVAMHSADLAVQALDKTLAGQPVDWRAEYVDCLMQGVDVFRYYVESWYNQRLQQVIFSDAKNAQITAMITAILAGYAWDTGNPFVKHPERLDTVAKLCQP
ncbi:MAG: FAD-dependent oxidoreductase [Gammaproteobacteria bacterium]|nr:MAG: FAD-dependent oxidoreductase [Gammaproteobacteria bacterium]